MGTQYVHWEVETDFFYRNRMKSRSGSGAGPSFVRPEAYTIFGALFMTNHAKITTTNVGTKANICLGPLPGRFKGPVQLTDLKRKQHQLYSKSARVPYICRWSLAEEAPFQSQGCPLDIYGVQSGTGTAFYPSTSVFPCQYHSTKATCTFTDISPILYQGYRILRRIRPPQNSRHHKGDIKQSRKFWARLYKI